MISTDITTRLMPQTPAVQTARRPQATHSQHSHPAQALTGLLLLLACLGAGWFAYQYALVPQPKDFLPEWHNAQWVSAPDGNPTSPTAYFRYATTLQVAPDNAFFTIAASQIFSFYVNGVEIGSNSTDFANYPRSYIYEVTPSLILGVNVFAIRVDNLDGQMPLLRASFGVVVGGVVTYYGTGGGAGAEWLATTQTGQVYPQNTAITPATTAWTGRTFDASLWLPATSFQLAAPSAQASLPSRTPLLTVNPLLYEQPVSPHWVSAGIGQDGYFVRQITMPQNASVSWLRIAATGTAEVYINGNLIFTWNYHRTSFSQIAIDPVTGKEKVRHIPELVLGVYDVSPFLHDGLNTIAIHISLQNVPGLRSIQVTAAPALSMDVLSGDAQGNFTWIASPDGYSVSHQAAPGWINGGAAVSGWASPTLTGRPDGYSIVYVSRSSQLTRGQQAVQNVPLTQIALVAVLSILAVLGLWLLVSLLIVGRFLRSASAALAITSLAYLPALCGEGLLIIISKEPQVTQPFPYTALWMLVLLIGVAVGYLLLGMAIGMRGIQRRIVASEGRAAPEGHVASEGRPQGYAPTMTRRVNDAGHWFGVIVGAYPCGRPSDALHRSSNWLKFHWPIFLLILLTAPLVFYNLGYEAYWQDELVSYFVAKSIQHNGLPMLPSGFIYPKGELYSYLLALFMSIFGDQNGAPRAISGIEYLLTLALLYHVGCYFFDRRVALIAAILLAFSPHELIWARQMRMYQQAQFLTLLTTYLFYRAVQSPRRVWLVYLATGALIVTYVSHEETFIVMPALVVCLLMAAYVMGERSSGGARATARRRPYSFLPYFFYQKHWWIAATVAIAVIGTQLLITKVTHPPVLGTDNTMRPMIQLTTDNIPYYLNMLFTPTSNDPSNSTLVSNIPSSIMLDSLLMILGCLFAVKSNHLPLRFIAVFFVVGFLTLTFIFTMQADRYFYPLVTFYYLLAAFAFVKIASIIWKFAKTHMVGKDERVAAAPIARGLAFPLKLLVGLSAALALLSVLLLPMFPLNNYNLFVSRLFNFPYYHHFGDYDEAGLYIREHMRQGDIVISIIPDTVVMYYAGQSDYFFSINHALFLFEQDGHIVDTYSGKVALLRQSDLDTVLDTHARIWLFSADNHYQNEVLRHFIIPPDFHVMYSGADSIVYLRGG